MHTLWAGKKCLLIKGNCEEVFKKEIFSNVLLVNIILASAQNAFEKYDNLLERVLETQREYDLVLISLSPTATVLSYDLALRGYQLIDIGRINKDYNYFLENNKSGAW